MTVYELSSEELDELRSSWYHQHLDDGSLEEVMGYNCDDEDSVPIDLVISYYEGTTFVKEDFFCNL